MNYTNVRLDAIPYLCNSNFSNRPTVAPGSKNGPWALSVLRQESPSDFLFLLPNIADEIRRRLDSGYVTSTAGTGCL